VSDVTKYLVTDDKGDFVIEVPKNTGWKITFGYVNPAVRDDGMGRRGGHCLRVYEGKDLRAVFGNVTGIRDLAIPLARRMERQVGESRWTMDSAGNFEESKSVKVDRFMLPDGDDDNDGDGHAF
jgi:hypothetical protein